ncbi:unnamed protein product [Rotaria sordida]|uniref:Uncharacterized protein n=1 Tax=Rotaria sordida TaxID=392033 RepID=A0A814H7Z2_9BILA|nr:unnamed protein product [Rotaria sordida]CAF1102574.1 unnamed protein product [Rotaria sordida]
MPYNSPSFITNGYVNQALSFNAAANQSLYTSYIPITNSSFTVDIWLYPTGYPNVKDHSIVGLCSSRSTSMCLHFTIRNTSSAYYLYMGFMNNDCSSAQTITLNRWTHAGFVFDLTTMKQWVYVNGVLSRTCTAQAPIMVNNSNITIGTIPVLAAPSDNNVFQGYMDQLIISKRAKSACEILEEATLAARFPFDSGSALVDYGPNSGSSSASSYSIISSGHSLQAISFTGSSSSYFQASGFTAFSINNQPFSISLWVQPQSLSGSLVHLSTSSNGAGSWCNSLLGFASNGALVAQIYDGSIQSVTASTLLSLSPSWTHVVQTWSPTSGLRLYVNNVLVASRSSATIFTATGTTPNYITLANGRSASGSCAAGAIGVLGPFSGAVDDFRIYSRELTVTDVCALYSS